MTDKQNYFTYTDNTSNDNDKTMENLHKQIIIDGVDVSGCPYYCGHDICKNTCHYFCTPCEWVDVQNCTYKQFIQAEQTVEECHKYQAELEDKLEDKEQECEELKKGLNLILTVQKNCKECPHQKLDVDVLVCDLDCATAFKKIAKQTLKKLENKNV